MIELQRAGGKAPSDAFASTEVSFYLATQRHDQAIATFEKMVASGIPLSPGIGSVLLDAVLSRPTDPERAKQAFAVFAEPGIPVNLQHWSKVIKHFAELGDLYSVKSLVKDDVPFAPNRVHVGTVVNEFSRFGTVPEMMDYLRTVPVELLSSSEVWSSIIIPPFQLLRRAGFHPA
ncbi:hypothetical protein DFJ74DRAFT_201805 [Hyaloraphidium curvatum]|nr:hypothetical protein DFJ74DRAFT_201805 [Hyaloraphidium curvatum]